MRLYVPQFYRLQQKVLNQSWNHENGTNGGSEAPSIDELILLTHESKSQILRAVNALQEKELAFHNPQTDKVHCRPKGKLILFKEDILDEGWEKFKVNLLRWMQIVGIITASAIAVSTFVLTYTTTNSNKIEIGKLQKEIEYLKLKPVSVRYLPERPITRPLNRDSLRKE